MSGVSGMDGRHRTLDDETWFHRLELLVNTLVAERLAIKTLSRVVDHVVINVFGGASDESQGNTS